MRPSPSPPKTQYGHPSVYRTPPKSHSISSRPHAARRCPQRCARREERILEHFAEPAIKGLLEDLLYYAKDARAPGLRSQEATNGARLRSDAPNGPPGLTRSKDAYYRLGEGRCLGGGWGWVNPLDGCSSARMRDLAV